MSVIINNYHGEARETDGKIGDAWNYVKDKWNRVFRSDADMIAKEPVSAPENEKHAFNDLHCADLVENKKSLKNWNAPACVSAYEKENFKKVYAEADEYEKEMLDDAIGAKCVDFKTNKPLDPNQTQYPKFCKELT